MNYSVQKLIVGTKSFDLRKDFSEKYVNVWKDGSTKILLRKIQIFEYTPEGLQEILKISHEFNQRILGSTIDSDWLYLALEYGISLQEYLEKEDKNRTKEFNKILELLKQLAEALMYLHSQNLVHYYLFPKDILVVETSEKQIKFTNFGISPDTKRQLVNFLNSLRAGKLVLIFYNWP